MSGRLGGLGGFITRGRVEAFRLGRRRRSRGPGVCPPDSGDGGRAGTRGRGRAPVRLREAPAAPAGGPERTGSSGFTGDGGGPGWLAGCGVRLVCFGPGSSPPPPQRRGRSVPECPRPSASLPAHSLPTRRSRGAGPGLTSPRDRFVQILCVLGERVFRPGVRWLLRDVPPGCPPRPSP